MLRDEDTRKPLENTLKFSGVPESIQPAIIEAFVRAGMRKQLINLFNKKGLKPPFTDLTDEADLDAAHKKDPRNEELTQTLVKLQTKRKDWDRAVATAARHCERGGSSYSVWESLVNLLLKRPESVVVLSKPLWQEYFVHKAPPDLQPTLRDLIGLV